MPILEKNKVYQMDCFSFLEKIDDETIDLAVIDPPYNLKKADWDTFDNEISFFDFTKKWIDSLLPKLKITGSLYIFNTPYNSAFILQHLLDRNMIFKNWITWDKRDGFSYTKRKYINSQETILFFTKSEKYVFNFEDIRTPYESTERIEAAKKKGILKNGKRWFPNPNGRLCGEVWHITSERLKNKVKGKTQKQFHLTPKPYELIERIIKASSNPNDLVLDCFVGSGTTAVVSKNLNRNFICADSSEKFVSYTEKRLEGKL